MSKTKLIAEADYGRRNEDADHFEGGAAAAGALAGTESEVAAAAEEDGETDDALQGLTEHEKFVGMIAKHY